MVQVVYIDVLFAINLIVNYLILFATAIFSGMRIKRGRLLLGAGAGAVYGCVVFFQNMQLLSSLVIKVLMGVVMVSLAFGLKCKGKLVKLFLIFCGISFAFGGGVLAIYLLLRGSNGIMDMRNGVFYLRVPMGVLLIATAVLYALFRLIFRRSISTSSAHQIQSIRVCGNGKEAGFQALVDTGNSLKDPLTNNPVVIAEYQAIRDILPLAVRQELDKTDRKDFAMALTRLPIEYKFKLVPYKTVGNEFDMLLAFQPDAVFFDGKKENGVLIAISPNQISDGGAYTALTGAAV